MKKPQLRGHWLLALLLLLGWAPLAQAQVTTDPVFFTVNNPVTLTFDATQGNGGLATYTGDVYIWTGVITNLSANDTNWRYVVGNSYNVPIAAEKMTNLGNHKYSITITPSTYYPGLAASGETVRKLAMVFRASGGSPEGKGTGGSDILLTVPTASTAVQVAFTSPANTGFNPTVVTAGSSLSVAASASASATLTLSLNGTQVAQTTGTTITSNVTITQPGVNTLTVTANAGGTTATATTTVLVPPTPATAALPAGAKTDGITYLANGTSAILSLTAPTKGYVYVLGDFNNWQITSAGLMNKTSTLNTDPTTGRWWVQIDNLTPGTEYAYQFLVDGNIRVADPYCDKILDSGNDQYIPAVTYPNLKAYPTGKTSGIVSVLQTGQTPYTWTNTTFTRPARTNMVVYELHIRDFVARHDYATLTDTLKYLQRLGVNVIELMPVNEFEGNDSWGYNPSFYFAPDKYYGTKTALKQFIDAAHSKGMAVVLDMVLNHTCGSAPMVQLYFDGATGKPAANSPWYNVDATHPYNVCNDFNHSSAYTKLFTKNVIKYWLQEYHVDGYRFDLAGGFTQTQLTTATYGNYDQQRIDIWKDYYNYQMSVDNTSYPILEHFPDNNEGKVLADYGMMLWGNLNYNYNQGTMGYLSDSDVSYGYYGNRNWTYPNLITYMESHDEERLQNKNTLYGNGSGSYNVKTLATGLARDEMAAAFFFTQPGARMIWEFGEVGYDYSINACSDGVTIDNNCRTSAKPIRWDYYQNASRRHLYDVYRAMIALKKQPAFASPTSFVQDLGNTTPIKQMRLVGPGLSVVTVGNFDVVPQTATITFPSTGTWYNYLNGVQTNVTSTSMSMTLQPGQYAVYTSQKVNAPAGTTLATRSPETTAFKLSLAPNPAAGSTTIAYELPTAATASIAVQNMLGQTVRQLTPARQAAGAQSQSLALQGLAPGVYLVKLQAGDQAQTARLLVE